MNKKKLIITCQEAVLFVSKKEEKKLSIVERVSLFIHLLICEFCRLFEKQNRFLYLNVKNLHTHDHLSETEKKSMEENLVLEEFE